MSANVFLRVPGAAVNVDPTPPDGRTTRYGSRGHSRSPRPARCLVTAVANAQRD